MTLLLNLLHQPTGGLYKGQNQYVPFDGRSPKMMTQRRWRVRGEIGRGKLETARPHSIEAPLRLAYHFRSPNGGTSLARLGW